MNSLGYSYNITLIGSSHGHLVGVVIDGVPSGEKIDVGKINTFLARRRPGQSKVTTNRKEDDQLVVETGIIDGIASGEPITAFVRNKDIVSSYYDEIKNTPRPGHADYPARIKYKGWNDIRGGGRFSGRMTVGLVIAGEIARQILMRRGISILAFTKSIAHIENTEEILTEDFIYSNSVRSPDPKTITLQEEYILQLKQEGDSCGGIIECRIEGVPVGVGEPWFNSIESTISHMIFSIPAVKGIEFGVGFAASQMRGSEHNDPYSIENGKVITKSNNAGGILGGISNGMPIIFRAAIKPTSSIKILQNTVDLENMENSEIKMRGRHDPCIVPRAVPVIQASAACVLLDLMRLGGFIK